MTQHQSLAEAAQRIEYETEFSGREAVVLAGMKHGISEDDIATELGDCVSMVRRVKSNLRQRKIELEDEIGEKKRTLDTLDAL